MPKLMLPIDAISEDYLAGESTRVIGKRYGCSGETIRRALHDNGTRLRTKSESLSGDKNPMYGMSGDKNPFYGKHHTEETIQFLRDNMRDVSGENNPMYGRRGKDAPCYGRCGELHPMFGKRGAEVGFFGRHHTDETKKILSEQKIGMFVGEKSPVWKGGFDRKRPYVLPEAQCIKMNTRSLGDEFHHISKSIGIYIPHGLHRHVPHNMATGWNMGEMNMLALQFINGGYDG